MTYYHWLGRKAEKYHRRDQIAERIKKFTAVEDDGLITHTPKL